MFRKGCGNKVSKRMFSDSAWLNSVSFELYYERITQLAMSRIKWQNLPPEIDARFLEWTLFYDGMAVFFHEPGVGYAALQTMIGGRLNIYRIPIWRKAYSVNGFQRKLNNKNSVIIFNNQTHTSSELGVRMFAYRLSEMDNTISVNLNAQKTPVLVACDEQQRLTMLNLYEKYTGNQPFIFGNKLINTDSLKAIKTDAPFVSDKIYRLKVDYWNECLTYLGISNSTINKAERVNTDEVNRSMGGTLASRASYLDSRNQAADMINRMFGLDVSAEWNEQIDEMAQQMQYEMMRSEMIGGGENGSLHGGTA